MKLSTKRFHPLSVLILAVCFLVAAAIIFLTIVASRDLDDAYGRVTYQPPTPKPLELAWPSGGQAAIGLMDSGLKAKSGDDSVRPIASLAKIITALVVLESKPLADNPDPIILTQADVDNYFQTIRQNGSNLLVLEGEQLSEKQMLEAMLLVSANNVADSLVVWAFGSFDNYKAAAERWLAQNQLSHTTIGADASGLDSGTASNLDDMFKISQLAIENPTVAEIVAQNQVELPTGLVENTNKLLEAGYIGLKTGNSDQAGSCLLFAKKSGEQTIIGVLLGQPFGSAFEAARQLTDSAEQNLTEVRIPAGTEVGQYQTAWGQSLKVSTAENLAAVTWPDQEPEITLAPISPSQILFEPVGELSLGGETVELRLDDEIKLPSLAWRLKNLDKLGW